LSRRTYDALAHRLLRRDSSIIPILGAIDYYGPGDGLISASFTEECPSAQLRLRETLHQLAQRTSDFEVSAELQRLVDGEWRVITREEYEWLPNSVRN
jgi:hypothetical protein